MKKLTLVLACASLLAAPTLPAPAPQASAELDPSVVKESIDRALRWLRSQQDEHSGAYGSASTTILVLRAFCESPRAYRTSDGPFVSRAVARLCQLQQPDGSIADPDAGEEYRRLLTREALRVLALQEDERARAAAGRALDFLGEDRAGLPATTVPSIQRARSLLALQAEDGSWSFGTDRVHSTALSVTQLNALLGVLAKPAAEAPAKTVTSLPPFSPADRAKVETALERGASFLLAERADGLWGFQGHPDPGITAMVARALLATPAPRTGEVQAAIERALDWLVGLQKPDGSIHAGQLANYVTSASVMALARAGREQDRKVIAKAREFLELLQADEGEGYSADDPYYGGVGYGGDERPDLSNMQMALEALSAAGLEEGDETFRKALVFLQRCQNRSESNDLVLVRDGVTTAAGNDGGAGYAPGDSKAGFVELADGRRIPRSYGSMTYALLKGYLFAGLPKEDPRVEAAWKWLSSNYTLDVNPGFEDSADPTAAYQGLFYYFTTMARALDLYGAESVVDGQGRAHAWRSELCGRLCAMQRQDGSWVNANAPRWYEGNPVLATAYAMTALDTALPAD
jgi:squalene-hopene/tetraprenyl-beta-curcumene cyclase